VRKFAIGTIWHRRPRDPRENAAHCNQLTFWFTPAELHFRWMVSWTRLCYWGAATTVGVCAILQWAIDEVLQSIDLHCYRWPQAHDLHTYFAFRREMGIGQIIIHVFLLGLVRWNANYAANTLWFIGCGSVRRGNSVFKMVLWICNAGIVFVLSQSIAAIFTMAYDCTGMVISGTTRPQLLAGLRVILGLEIVTATILAAVLMARIFATCRCKTDRWFHLGECQIHSPTTKPRRCDTCGK
jgi:hypothetical protein